MTIGLEEIKEILVNGFPWYAIDSNGEAHVFEDEPIKKYKEGRDGEGYWIARDGTAYICLGRVIINIDWENSKTLTMDL